MLFRRLCLFLCITLSGVMVLAAEAPTPLSLRECIALALQRQSDVLQGERALDAANARRAQAGSGYYPQISLEASTQVLESGVPRLGGSDVIAIGVTQNFYDGGLREARVERARHDAAQSSATLERTRQTVTFNVVQSYLQLLRAKQQAGVADARVHYIEGQRALVQTRIQVGDAAEVELLPIEAQLANARVDALAAANGVRTAAIRLQQAMGLTPAPGFTVQDVTVPADLAMPTLEDAVKTAQQARPEVRASRAGVAAAEASVATAKIGMYPRPVISGQLDQQVNGGAERTVSISAGIGYDLFTGGRTSGAYQEARAGLAGARVRADQVGRDIAAQVQEASLNCADARERMGASDVSVASAQRNMAAQEERYRQGLAIPLDLLNAQLELTTASSNAVQARYDYYTALAQFDYALGRQGGWYAD